VTSSCAGTSGCTCGCCAGTSVQTPQMQTNLPGLPAVAYRAGTWATFKESMLARLSSSDYPALAGLKTRANDDFTIALLDATSIVLDVLTFYQERLANESYLRTAVQPQSLTELSRLIGYQPAPGVSASCYVAFTLQTAPGQPVDPATPVITIPAGTQVQSVPAQNQNPQLFETSADIQAKPDWNALAVATGRPWAPHSGGVSVYLEGTATQLQPGEMILIVGDERLHSPSSQSWDIRQVTKVRADAGNKRTYVEWSEGLRGGGLGPSQRYPKFFAFRQRTSLFGYNAVNPLMLTSETRSGLSSLLSGNEWDFGIRSLDRDSLIDLDAVHTKIVSGGWIALVGPAGSGRLAPAFESPVAIQQLALESPQSDALEIDPAILGAPTGPVHSGISLYLVESVTTLSRSDFGLSARISRVGTDTAANLQAYYNNTRITSVLAQSEELAVAQQPFDYPLYGLFLDLQELRSDLIGASVVGVSGTRQKIAVNVTGLSFVPADPNATPAPLNPGDILTLTSAASLPLNQDHTIPDWRGSNDSLILTVEDSQGQPGTVEASLSDFTLSPSTTSDPEVSEIALVDSIVNIAAPYPHTRIQLQSGLMNCYNRDTTTVNANVGLATHGQSVTEILGNGSASTPNQSFTLKQSPLTYVQAATPTGRQSTLQVRASAVAWTGVPSLYQQGPSAQVFTTLNQPDGTTDVFFGDGVEGSPLPTGQSNIHASYRIGSGAAGNIGANTLATLMDRPLGVSGVTNPSPASGGQDAQAPEDVRSTAPQTVLTLGRAVSITDYQSYAATFAGISKAHAMWIPNGPARGVFLTVAGVAGQALPPGDPTLSNLVMSLRNYGSPLIPIAARGFLETLFGLSADIAYDPSFARLTVETAVRQALSQAYSFANRTFGQGVSADELAAVIQAVPGVVAVNVISIQVAYTSSAGDLAAGGYTETNLHGWLNQLVPQSSLPRLVSPMRLCAYLPTARIETIPQPAEILVMHPDPHYVVLGVMA